MCRKKMIVRWNDLIFRLNNQYVSFFTTLSRRDALHVYILDILLNFFWAFKNFIPQLTSVLFFNLVSMCIHPAFFQTSDNSFWQERGNQKYSCLSVYTHGNIKLIKVDIPMSVYIVEYFLEESTSFQVCV